MIHKSIEFSVGSEGKSALRVEREKFVNCRNFFQFARAKLRIRQLSGMGELNGIEKIIGRWSEESSFMVLGSVIPDMALLKTKSTVEGLPRGGMRVGVFGLWIRKRRESHSLTMSDPFRQFLSQFHRKFFALKSPEITLRPVTERTLEKKERDLARDAAGEQ